ncbi:unnamed protein product [Blepharisma stoltei]|uniref:Uncharacterized protein n=1 Tax=Blepharisma stoltei TaxID=1481888 RepID=A0AAU9JLP2_9CILI|nr:unnamed protein product [Blepharisma stoltei]
MIFSAVRSFKSSSRLFARQDYYKILGVSSKSTESEIKKAYFNLAKKFHPDVNKSPDAKNKFAEINQAYETLGDPEKRRTYDATGMTGDEQDQAKSSGFPGGGAYSSSNSGGFNPFEQQYGGFGNFSGQRPQGYTTFDDIFGEFEDFFNLGQKEKKSFKGEDITVMLEISFMEAALGTKKQIQYEQRGVCDSCFGKKTKSGSNPMKCLTCGGRGVVFIQRGPISMSVTCQKCKGAGTIIRDPCQRCNGSGLSYQMKMEVVNIPNGVHNGQHLRMANKGHHSQGEGPPGDLLLKIHVAEHPIFKREGFDVMSEVYISPAQAALGATIDVETLHGKTKVSVDPGTSPGFKKKIPGKGIFHVPPSTNKGDHYVIFKLKVPKTLTTKQRELYQQLAAEEGSEVDNNSGVFSWIKGFYKK